MTSWVWSNFSNFIETKKLVFFEVKNDVSWSSPRSKNLAHRLAKSPYLFNLDADNFVDLSDINSILKAKNKNLPCHQFSGSFGDGSFGRIGLPKEVFYKIGGYDESMFPMGGQDLDLLRRINALSISILRLSKSRMQSIQNSFTDKVQEFSNNIKDHKELYAKLNSLNILRSRLRLDIEGPIIKGGFATFRGLLNGTEVVIDGFNKIRPVSS
jgi:predicted glycosyltransferase involved in capsule biosynthesis